MDFISIAVRLINKVFNFDGTTRQITYSELLIFSFINSGVKKFGAAFRCSYRQISAYLNISISTVSKSIKNLIGICLIYRCDNFCYKVNRKIVQGLSGLKLKRLGNVFASV